MTALDVALVVVRLAIGCWLLWSLPRIGIARPAPGTTVSVVIPARDEEAQLPALLASLDTGARGRASPGPAPEVIVVDDDSSDATATVAAAGGARVVVPDPLPEGWTGKAWACAAGAAVASGDVLVFVDADVRFATGALDRVVGTLGEEGGLVSVQPRHEPGAVVERLAALFNVVAVAGTDMASPTGRVAGSRGAFGPVLATSRADYDAVGGHRAIRDSVVDDVALAQAYRASGRSVGIRAGADDVSFRMYPKGLRQLVEGFTKNLSAGAGAVRLGTVGLVALWLSLLVQAAFAPVVAVFTGAWSEALALYVVVAAQLWWMSRRVGRFGPITALALPAHVVLFLAVFVRSAIATARGSVSWRGRRIPTRPPRGR